MYWMLLQWENDGKNFNVAPIEEVGLLCQVKFQTNDKQKCSKSTELPNLKEMNTSRSRIEFFWV